MSTPPLSVGPATNRPSPPEPISTEYGLIASPSTQAIWTKGFLSWFWTNYSPRSGSSIVPVKGPLWLYLALRIPQPTAILQNSLLALAVVRSGRASDDNSVVIEGQRLYGQAVKMLQRVLEDREQILHEENLAAVRAMVLYELYEATSSTADSWFGHITGLSHLLVARGPQMYDTPLARAVFEEVRYPLMIRCIMVHQGYPFSEAQWRTGPWASSPKGKEQLLYDHGFSLASILHKLDALAEAAQDPAKARDPMHLIDAMKSIVQLDDELEKYKKIYLQDSMLLSLSKSELPFPDWTDGGPLLDEMSFHLEGLVMTWWAIKLFLMAASSQLASKTQALVNHLPPPIAGMHKRISQASGDEIRNHVGHCILQSIPLVVQENMGQFETSRTIFPLTAATFQFRNSEPETEVCRRLRTQIASRKGFKFARGIE
ncbi:hypothetical protein LTR10_013628 [Elasticomyces elasticus]|nr:hypothetical protein LTR10_013628 [Elasticomyces elasticus]KAK5187446.1 hypothetical protein LTR44_000262 [Eurotiomycetes sp. CCFEE 6388]